MWAKIVLFCAATSVLLLIAAIFVPFDGYYSADTGDLGLGLGLICAFYLGILIVDVVILIALKAVSVFEGTERRTPELSMLPDALLSILYVFYLGLSFFELPAKPFISQLKFWQQDFSTVTNFAIVCAIYIILKIFLSKRKEESSDNEAEPNENH